ncbi:hypothetical protein JG559_12415 [Enterococcus faecalis]|uniref:Uncharacterized protein n=1 Tax=Enterococcus faecalis TaxID=1351 RepID=A0A974NZQ5_ENTFL|nr:hypothetical protein JG559_12415 [Enterococcus faecalis]
MLYFDYQLKEVHAMFDLLALLTGTSTYGNVPPCLISQCVSSMVFHTWHVSFKTDSIILQTDRQIQPKIIGFLLRKRTARSDNYFLLFFCLVRCI